MSDQPNKPSPSNSAQQQADASTPVRIDVNNAQDLRSWVDKLDATADQIREAVQTVGDRASDVEEHLKGSRSTTNAERVRQAT